ncbi:MAG: hypothetical protein M3O46_22750 [Myxococcota bacterium]|nr:hypothetical protein [Myxococcota bacterium]
MSDAGGDDAPIDGSATAPSDGSTDGPRDASADTPRDTFADASSDGLGGGPSDASSDAPYAACFGPGGTTSVSLKACAAERQLHLPMDDDCITPSMSLGDLA